MALEVTGKYIRIRIQYKGTKVNFRWPEPASEASVRAAERAQNRIKRDLEDGVFQSVENYLPFAARTDSFSEVSKRWIKSSNASLATRNEYRKALNKYWLPTLGAVPLSTLKPSTLREVISSTEFPSPKTKNNALIPLRQILAQAYLDELTPRDLSPFVKGEKFQRKPPDPFSREEAEQIIDYFRGKHFGPYFEFMFYTGLRTGEGLGLRWESVDLRGGSVQVSESQSKGRHLHTTKTGRARIVKLHNRAASALQRQRKISAGEVVFVTAEGVGYITEKAQRKAFTDALKALGIRHRPQYNTRASYISWMLMANVNVFWLAQQCGNSPEVIYKHYAKWIDSDDDQKELDKLS